MKYSIVLPCKDEEQTIKTVILQAQKYLPSAEIIVVDNNSRDKSASIAKSCNVIVVREHTDGYGAALLRGFGEAKGEYIIMCDADNTYDFAELHKMLRYTDAGKSSGKDVIASSKNYDIIIGNRFNDRMKQSAMPLSHKYLGNPILSFMMRMLFHIRIKDTHSGFRIIKKESLKKLNLESTGMELASEMLIKASIKNMRVKEVNITYSPRIGHSKLNSFNDGWKHLKMMLLYSPNQLFLIPGIILFTIGMILSTIMLFGPIKVLGFRLDIHPAIIGSLLSLLGYQILMLWLFAKTYRITILGEKDRKDRLIEWIHRHFTLENVIILGGIILVVGLAIGIVIIAKWFNSNFGALFEMRQALFAMTLMIIGVQTIFSGFLLSILGTRHKTQ